MSQHAGMVWVRDKVTGNRHRWPEAEAKKNDNLDILKYPIELDLPVQPAREGDPIAEAEAAAEAEKAAVEAEATPSTTKAKEARA